MHEESLFGSLAEPQARVGHRAHVLITVKAAPNPSSTYGETVCVAGLRTDIGREGWVRLYPINFRELETENRFAKYDIIEVELLPVRGSDSRPESWRPNTDSVKRVGHIKPGRDWGERAKVLEPFLTDTMCQLLSDSKAANNSRSLGFVRPAEVMDLRVEPHRGWTQEQQAKIDGYVRQLALPGLDDSPRTPLEAPRFKATYRYRCLDSGCSGHSGQNIDWEVVAFQRKMAGVSDAELSLALKKRFLEEICGPDRRPAFFVGNQAARRQTFSVLGVYYPRVGT